MKILYNGKSYTANRKNDGRLIIIVDKKEVFAGFGENNMVAGFEIGKEVKKDDSKI